MQKIVNAFKRVNCLFQVEKVYKENFITTFCDHGDIVSRYLKKKTK